MVRQPGRLTRLVAGCEGDAGLEQAARRSTLEPASVYFHPSFVGAGAERYPQRNRPLGLQHWLRHARPPPLAEAGSASRKWRHNYYAPTTLLYYSGTLVYYLVQYVVNSTR